MSTMSQLISRDNFEAEFNAKYQEAIVRRKKAKQKAKLENELHDIQKKKSEEYKQAASL